jgi:hypothetical protein
MKIQLQRALVTGLLLAMGLSITGGAVRACEGMEKGTAHRVQPATTEPAPPLSAGVRLVSLQKNASGGVASMSLDAQSGVDMEEVTLSVSLPEGVIFTDGTRSKTWTATIASGGSLSYPFDLLVSRDGKFIVSGEAAGVSNGKPVHRGFSQKLLVGVQEKDPKPKDGAIEFPGTPGGGI